jgi:23S rRNA A2030 N6-methylase RlmJ
MANKHYGNLADVFKHVALAEILATVRPAEYWESHAGSAYYEELPDVAAIPAERLHGVHYVAQACDDVLQASAYGRILERGMRDGLVWRIPGSPLLAFEILGEPLRRALFCDIDAASLETVRQRGIAVGGTAEKIECVQEDGISVLRGAALLLPEHWPGSTLAFIDPYDIGATTESDIAPLDLWCETASRGIMSVIWYGFADAQAQSAVRQQIQRGIDKAKLANHGGQRLEGTLLHPPVEGKANTLWGFGLLVMNVPRDAMKRVDFLLRALEHSYREAPLAGGETGSGAWAYVRADI